MSELPTSHTSDALLIGNEPTAATAETEAQLFPGWNLMLEHFVRYLNQQRSEPEERILFDAQVPVMEDLFNFLRANPHDPRGYITLPTGTGKTVLFAEFVKATGLNALVLVPTIPLLEQTEREFNSRSPAKLTIGKVYGEVKEPGMGITLSTYASFVKHTKDKSADALIRPGDYDLVILDESHHALAPGTRAALRDYTDVVKLGLTATPNYSERRRLSSLLPNEIHKMSLQEATRLGLIAPSLSVLIQTHTDLSQVSLTQSRDYNPTELESALDVDPRNRMAAEVYVNYLRGRKTIFSCAGIQHAIDMAEMLRSYGVKAEAIYGAMPKERKHQIRSQLALPIEDGGLEAICHAKLLAEGFDEPAVSVCFNLAPTTSHVREQQRSGRALRNDPADPTKIAIVIDVIDINYQLPPVIFADAMIAATAELAPLGFEHLLDNPLAQIAPDRFANSEFIIDPSEIVAIAEAFTEMRQKRVERAPRGWLPLYEIALSWREAGVSYEKIRLALAWTKQIDPDFVSEHRVQYSITRDNRALKVPHYSPILQQRLAARIGGNLLKYLEGPEEANSQAIEETEQILEPSPSRISTRFGYLLERDRRQRDVAKLITDALKLPLRQ